MSKLAHSDEESMAIIELRDRYEDSRNDNEFFEEASGNGIDPDLMEKALGSRMSSDYATFMYLYLK